MNRPDRIDGEKASPPPRASFDLASAQPADFADIWQHLVDGLSEQIALLDENWTILVVNRAWANLAMLYGPSAFMPGANYLQSCRDRAEQGFGIAIDVVKGIEEIIAGERASFRLLYRSDEPETGQDHELCIERFQAGGRMFASVTRYDMTGNLELRRLREEFSRSVIAGQAEERRRIGREIHDSTMQLIACLGLKIGELEHTGADGLTATLDEMKELVAETRQAIQAISYLTHPPLLENAALPEALEALVNGFGRRTGLDLVFETSGETGMSSPAIEEAAYRIVQEGLSNVHRHAKTNRATVRLVRSKTHTHVVVADDGIGMPDVVESGVGLAGMRSRLAELDGRLSIRPGRPGTTIIASIPAPVTEKRYAKP